MMPPRIERAVADWHLKPELAVSILGAIGALLAGLVGTIISGVSAYDRLGERIAIAEHQVSAQRDRDTGQDRILGEDLAAINRRLDRIDGNVDRLLASSGARR